MRAKQRDIKAVQTKAALDDDLPDGLIKKTLREIGKNLPYGRSAFTSIGKAPFSLRDFDTSAELSISRAMVGKKADPASMLIIPTKHLLKSLGDKVFGNDLAEAEMAIRSMSYGDALYIYVMARIEAVGSEIEIESRCGHCNHVNRVVGDLNDVDVLTIDPKWETNPCEFEFELKQKPIIVGGEERRILRCRPPLTSSIGKTMDGNIISYNFAKDSVFGVEGIDEEILLTDEHMGPMKKGDLERLKAEVALRTPLPMMIVEIVCQECTATYNERINWMYDNFFGSSSQ